MTNVDNMKHYDVPESNNTHAEIKPIKIVSVTTSPDVRASSTVKI